MQSKFIAALFIIAKTWKQLKGPLADEWIKKMYLYTVEYYSAIKRNGNLLFGPTWLDLGDIVLDEISQTEKNKQYHLYVEKNKPLNITKNKHTHRYREQTRGTSGEMKGGGGQIGVKDSEVQTTMYKVSKPQDMLYSSGNISDIL